jgi:UDP-N-acetyl-D-glucosamine/UDP-N-acetyl-D-galactosamine dehydrogenase
MNTPIISIIGLGYVGLPLAAAFAKKYKVIGFDINQQRVSQLQQNFDMTLEVEKEKLEAVNLTDFKSFNDSKAGLYCTTELSEIKNATIYIVTVPTPVDKNNKPDLTPLFKASETVSKVLKKGDIVIYESTVYPGATEEDCVPILEQGSGLVFNQDFFAGYSPERINPGDKLHTVEKILKVTSGSTPEIAERIDQMYKSIIIAGTFKASSIKVAEAAKVIENSQRDINIAFVNELSRIFNLMHIDTHEVLEAAGTKWNFIKFSPGLVGGHCIGVDPYYLADKALKLGYNPQIILSGRRLNDSMGPFVAQETVKKMIHKEIPIKGSKVLVLGITFKENCPDIRNSRVIDIIQELKTFDLQVDVYDPWALADEVRHEYEIDLITDHENLSNDYKAIILAVSHQEFMAFELDKYLAPVHVVYDVKGILPKDKSDGRL